MWWVVPFGLLLGFGTVFLMVIATNLLKHTSIEVSFAVTMTIGLVVMPVVWRLVRLAGHWLIARPRVELIRLGLDG